MGKIFVFCRIQLKFRFLLYKKRWHESWKFQLEITSNEKSYRQKSFDKLIWNEQYVWVLWVLVSIVRSSNLSEHVTRCTKKKAILMIANLPSINFPACLAVCFPIKRACFYDYTHSIHLFAMHYLLSSIFSSFVCCH